MTSTLVDQLRALPEDALGALLRRRPDLVVPVPGDLSVLASRLQSKVSVARALDRLDQFTLDVLDGLRLVRDDSGVAALPALLVLSAEAGIESGRVEAAVERLRALFLAYGPPGQLRLVRMVDELTTMHPFDLGRPASELDPDAADLVADPAGLRRTLLSAPPEARAV